MTDHEKLRKLFHAAMRAVDEPQAMDQPVRSQASQGAPSTTNQPLPAAAPLSNETPAPAGAVAAPTETNAGLDAASAAELAALLDEQHKRKTRKRRREALATLGVFLALTGGGLGWFVQSPARVQAFHEVMRDIHSVGDIQGLVAKYRAALDRVAGHAQQIDRSTESMGVSSRQDGEKDPNFDKEMRVMMGADGKTTGERNRVLQEKFGNLKPHAAAPNPDTRPQADPPVGKP